MTDVTYEAEDAHSSGTLGFTSCAKVLYCNGYGNFTIVVFCEIVRLIIDSLALLLSLYQSVY